MSSSRDELQWLLWPEMMRYYIIVRDRVENCEVERGRKERADVDDVVK